LKSRSGNSLALCSQSAQIEVLSLPARNLGHLDRLAHANFPQPWFRDARQIFMDCHQVVGLPARFREAFLQKFIK